MFDLRPAGYVIGLLLMVLGLTMVIPMGLDWLDGASNWTSFALSAFITVLIGSVAVSYTHLTLPTTPYV